MSFALKLHPIVLEMAMTQLAGRLKNVNAKIARLAKAGQEVPAALREEHRALQSCMKRLAKLGPQKPSFDFVAGDCLNVLATGVSAR
jgi:hypothetical protein